MPAPTSASRHYRRIQRLQATTIGAIRRAWRRMELRGNWETQYSEDVGPKATALVIAAQMAATTEANVYIPDVLAELGVEFSGPSVPRMALAGYAGDGRPVETLLEQSVVHAGRAFNQARQVARRDVEDLRASPQDFDLDRAAADALAEAERWIEKAVETVIADTVRAADSALIGGREWVTGYVRVLSLPSCSRCTILAGRYYHWNDGFERHERCDCLHVPTTVVNPDLLSVPRNPREYFDSLSQKEQDRIFTKAGAEAIRDGADINQVVNARRGMKQAQVFGRDVLVTDEGTTRRGFAYTRLPGTRASDRRRPGERYARTTAVRLMPEAIYQIAGDDRAEAIRLLKLHGYLI